MREPRSFVLGHRVFLAGQQGSEESHRTRRERLWVLRQGREIIFVAFYTSKDGHFQVDGKGRVWPWQWVPEPSGC